jgi:hypothetical protein
MKHAPVALALVLGLGACGSDSSSPSAPTPSAAPAPQPVITPPPQTQPPRQSNRPPKLELTVSPDPFFGGNHPFTITANMCKSHDPDNDTLGFVFKYGDFHHKYTISCREQHTYEEPGRYNAIFCVKDGFPDPKHQVCEDVVVKVH